MATPRFLCRICLPFLAWLWPLFAYTELLQEAPTPSPSPAGDTLAVTLAVTDPFAQQGVAVPPDPDTPTVYCAVTQPGLPGPCASGQRERMDWPVISLVANMMYGSESGSGSGAGGAQAAGSLQFLAAVMRASDFTSICAGSSAGGAIGLGCFSAAELLPLNLR